MMMVVAISISLAAADKAIVVVGQQRKKNLSSSLRYFCNDIEH